MKRIEKEIQRVEKVVEYESFDGKIWKLEEDCKQWEKSYEAVVRKMWNDLPKAKRSIDEMMPDWLEADIILITVRDENDMKTINAYLDTVADPCKYCGRVTFEFIGKDIVIVQSNYDDDNIGFYGTVDKFLESFNNRWNMLINELHPTETE